MKIFIVEDSFEKFKEIDYKDAKKMLSLLYQITTP